MSLCKPVWNILLGLWRNDLALVCEEMMATVIVMRAMAEISAVFLDALGSVPHVAHSRILAGRVSLSHVPCGSLLLRLPTLSLFCRPVSMRDESQHLLRRPRLSGEDAQLHPIIEHLYISVLSSPFTLNHPISAYRDFTL